ncbi:electron transport complex subunit RsxC [Peptoniphilaceae bacterium SGI.131]
MKEVIILVFGTTFKGGFHVHGYKELSATGSFGEVPAPKVLRIPMLMHIGAPCQPIVAVGDLVKVGQKIGEKNGFISSNIHSSVSGKVLKIEDAVTSRGNKVKTILIENDEEYTLGYELLDRKLEDLSPEEIVHIVEESGITGMGGASFPTQVKINPPKDKKIDSVIINAAECEPYLTSDDTILRNYSKEVIMGLRAVMKAVDAKDGYITIEDNKPEAVAELSKALEGQSDIKLVVAKTKYPQGDEKRIIDVTLHREVPSGGLPADVGAVVVNTATAYAIHNAVYKNIPLYQRIVTFTGNAINNPQNCMVRFGTPIDYALDYVGGCKDNMAKVLLGGPMMGLAQTNLSIPLEKANNGVTVMTDEESTMMDESPCIKCARCVEVCPVHLQPFNLEALVSLNLIEEAKEDHILDCIECGSCSYICPAHRYLVETIKIGKGQARALTNK